MRSSSCLPFRSTPRVVFFDLGQTLVSGLERSARVLLAERLGLSEKQAKRVGKLIMSHRSVESRQLSEAISRLLPERDPAEIEAHLSSLWREQEMSVSALPGAVPLVRSLKSLGIRTGIISNAWHPFHCGFLHFCGELSELFDFRILSYRQECKKPSTLLFRRALAEAGESATHAWMVGDCYELDIEPALKIGMHAIWLLRRPEKEIPLLARVLRGEKRSPDYTAEDLGEIQSFFARDNH